MTGQIVEPRKIAKRNRIKSMITSKDNEIIKDTVKLTKNAKYRREKALFTAEGVRLCRDGVMSGAVPEKFLFTARAREKYGEDFNKIFACAKNSYELSETLFEKICDTRTPQGFFCVFNMLDKPSFPYTINNQSNYVALENLQDPSNLGTVLRTAEALGIDGVILSRNCCDIYSPKVVRGSMGAVFRIPLYITENFTSFIAELTKRGVATYGSTPHSAANITDIKFGGGVMLIGNEGSGLTEETLAVCSQRVKIPMRGRAESLNAAAAASILMWEMFR